eukprot:jgi/Undpi1/11738/HiC_scaffold_37.g14033.m1
MIEAVVDSSSPPSSPGPQPLRAVSSSAELIVRRHWAAVRRYLRVLGADPATADDLAQDVFVVALRKGLEERGAQTASFLRKAAKNLFLGHLRRRKTTAVDVEQVFFEEEEGADSRREALHHCMDRLTDRVQHALRLAYGERASRERIAATLDLQPGGVKSMLRRARATLKECVERALGTTTEDHGLQGDAR